MNFNRINNIVGWCICLIACMVYILTAEAGGSLWDCGEFVSSCFKVQIPHPPGAPLFILLGRIFIVLFGDNPLTAAKAVNTMSALASGFTILFLFWTITHFARRIVQTAGKALSNEQIFTIMAAGVVGSLAYTFSDSFWFSAVEGEVYAMSSFFTAIVFWMMLKWEHQADEPGADKWIVLIFFTMGLSIGVHLLNLLTIPAIVMIYYFRKYKVTPWGTFIAFVIGCLITGFVQKFVIQYTVDGAGIFDRWFVNGLGLPFYSGFFFFFILLSVLAFFGLRVAKQKSWGFLKLGIWCFLFMLLGYSTYFTTLIRSAADPAVDMYNVDNPMALMGYLGREQYGDFPLLRGQVFTATPERYEEGSEKFAKSKDKYISLGHDPVPIYAPEDQMILPRVWDASNDQGHADFYQSWLGLGEGEAPTYRDNVYWAFSYQINWMYLRYFMWNFVGKQNDLQGFGNVRDGNWISGISFIDNLRLGNQAKIPDSIKHNKANNTFYFLPLILGLIGFYFHYTRNRQDFLVNFLLFFFTGLAVVFYLNQPGNQPRERDYAYVGSFYAFAIWIGLGVMMVKEWFSKFTSGSVANYASAALCVLAVPVLMGAQEWNDHDRSKKQLARDLAKDYLESCAPNAVLFSFGDNDTYPLWYAQEVEGIRPDIRVINYSLLGIDWYINQLRYKVNQSDPIDVLWTPEQIEGRKRDFVRYVEKPGISKDQYFDLYDLMKNILGSDDPANQVAVGEGEMINYFPVKKVSVPVDVNFVRKNKTVNANDSVVSELRFEIPKNILLKNDLAVLNIVAANKWRRPIYFTSPFGGREGLGFDNYIRSDGLSYRLVPVANAPVNTEWMVDKLMNKFAFGSADKKGVYFDEENRRHLLTIRMAYAQAASGLAQENKKDEAKKLLAKVDQNMLPSNMPYGMVSRQNQHNQTSMMLLEAAYRAGDDALADKIGKAVRKDLQDQIDYYNSLDENKEVALDYEKRRTEYLLRGLNDMERALKGGGPAATPETPGVINNRPDSPKPPAAKDTTKKKK